MKKARAAILLLAVCSSGCAYLGALFTRPTVSLRRVDLTAVSFTGIGANFVFGVDNPNRIGIDLARLIYQLSVDSHLLAEGHGNQPLHVPAGGSGELVLPVSIRFSDFVQSLAALVQKQTVPYTLATRLGFSTAVGILEIPLSSSGSFPVPRLPELAVGNASLSGLGLAGCDLAVLVNLTNRNGFALPLGQLAYRASIDGAVLGSGAAAPGSLAAGATQPMRIGLRIDFAQVGMAVARAVQSRTAVLSLDGDLDLGGYKMPLGLRRALQ